MKGKNIISLLIKVVIGLASAFIIFWRLRNELTIENLTIIKNDLFNLQSLFYLFVSLFLFPVNWGIESYKWKLITHQTEPISLKTAMKSVYGGVCVGNLAPGRATEFLAKIHFFKPENKLTVTVLHFVSGMFQLSITIAFGMLAILLKYSGTENGSELLKYISIILSVIVLAVFILILFNINRFIPWLYKRFKTVSYEEVKPIIWTKKLLTQLFLFSLIRYAVFAFQFYLLISAFRSNPYQFDMILGICMYFLFTTIIPMFSVIEAAVRAAIALIVFKDLGLSNAALALIAVMLWVVNIVVPSIVGYFVIINENLSLASFSLKRKSED